VQITKDMRKTLAKELRYCADKMSKEKSLARKIFFFSNAEEAVDSVIDFEYDPQLVLIQLVLDVSTATIAYRVELIEKGEDTSVELIEGLFDKLNASLYELSMCIEQDQDTYKIVERIAELAHATTDRGYFIYTKGLVKTQPTRK
jgi:hypothetical protein